MNFLQTVQSAFDLTFQQSYLFRNYPLAISFGSGRRFVVLLLLFFLFFTAVRV